MNKYLLIGIVAILVTVGGWWYFSYSETPAGFEQASLQQDGATQPQENQQTSLDPSLEAKGIATTKDGSNVLLVDTRTGISFLYPAEWGTVETKDERGKCPSVVDDPCNQRTYMFPSLAPAGVFLATETSGHEKYPPGRGGFWGDGAGGISQFFAGECTPATNCELITNTQGTIIAKRMGIYEFDDYGDTAAKKIGYYVFSNKGPYHGIILSATRISSPGDVREKQFEDVVISSLKLSAH